ncbi:hypothetical protein A2U01_0007101 [Trifolium medium]|uniref:Integrase zinc-binding domain-containing protein n=1 Tax=Trifolium medium TaxID=97028 RepID=A0A392MFG2_9FABA|nr:hypothetical protein [Trifolium medium]
MNSKTREVLLLNQRMADYIIKEDYLDSQAVTHLREFHTSPTGDHSGVFRTYRKIAQSLYWIGMKAAVTNYVAACHTCQSNKYQASPSEGLLLPLPIPNAAWEGLLLKAKYGYNTSFQSAAICTPFEIVHGRPPPSLARFVHDETLVEAVAQDLLTTNKG